MTDYYKDEQQMTDEQIAGLAPDWATHYRFNSFEVMYESTKKWMAIGLEFPFIKRGPYSQNSKLTKCKPIPIQRKPFDIDLVRREIHKTLTCDNSDKFMRYEDLPDYTINSYNKLIERFKLTAEDLK